MNHHPAKNLPTPDAAALAHSNQLLALIKNEIKSQGPISFARYMELALYAPGFGYYSAGAQKFGAAGDFVTAPEISPLFSFCIAKQIAQILFNMSDGDVLELGAGSGVMAADILLALEQQQCLPKHYYILEVSADLKQRQYQLLQQRIPHLLEKIIWLDNLAHFSLRGVIVANEVLDAMPVHRFYWHNKLQEYYVNWQHDQLIWQLMPPSQALMSNLATLPELADNYSSEINLALPGWLATLAQTLLQGVILIIDYGFPRNEYYHPQRDQGTLMCHYRHHAHGDPFLWPGLQDITAHVDFTAIATTAVSHDLEVLGYTSQANFLLACGITELLGENKIAEAQWQLSQQIKKLTLPSEMGELFKVIALGKAIDLPLLGFQWLDRRDNL